MENGPIWKRTKKGIERSEGETIPHFPNIAELVFLMSSVFSPQTEWLSKFAEGHFKKSAVSWFIICLGFVLLG